jgi:rhamnosyl/mannosyltransferase
MEIKSESKSQSKNIHVMIYTEAFYPQIGGGENYCTDLATTLVTYGFEVTILTPVQSKEFERFPFIVARLFHPLKLYGFNLNFLEILSYIRRYRPSLFHISGPTPIDFLLLLICRITGVPAIVTFHGKFNTRVGRLVLYIQGKLLYSSARSVLVQSVREMEFFRNLGLDSHTLKLFYFSGVDREKYSCSKCGRMKPSDSTNQIFKFVFVGGLTKSRPYKGVENLMKIFSSLYDTGLNNISLEIIGDGDLLPELKLSMRNYSQVSFLGRLPNEELVSKLCNANMLILPSVSNGEGFGKVVLEALSCNLPAMVSKFAGISELIKKYDAGIVFDPNDICDSVQKIVKIEKNRDLLTKYICNAERMIKGEELDLASTTKKTMNIYYETLNLQVER